MAEHLRPNPASINDIIDKLTGPLKARYVRAARMLLASGFNSRVSKILAFIKNEDPGGDKAPRLILGRDPRFTLLYQRFVSALEEAYFKVQKVTNADDFAKLGKKFSRIAEACATIVENDMSKYESTQQLVTLLIEFDVNVQTMRKAGWSETQVFDYAVLFAIKMEKVVISKNGVDVTFQYCRGSGDADTSLGNGEINCVSSTYFKCVNACPLGYHCKVDGSCCSNDDFDLVKGDDSVLGFIKYIDGPFINTYAEFGLDAKLVVHHNTWDVEFCSGKFVEYRAGQYIYVQKLTKLLHGLSRVINNRVVEGGHMAHYYATIGYMYAVLYKNLPVLSELGQCLMTVGQYKVNLQLSNLSFNLVQAFKSSEGVYKLNVEYDTCMASLCLTMGLSIEDLTSLKRRLANSRLVVPDNQYKTLRSRGGKADLSLHGPRVEAIKPVFTRKAECKHYKSILPLLRGKNT